MDATPTPAKRKREKSMATAKQNAIEAADAELNNAGLPTYTQLLSRLLHGGQEIEVDGHEGGEIYGTAVFDGERRAFTLRIAA